MNDTGYNNRIFAEGVHGVLRVNWTLRCETPLAIRNGLFISYEEPKIIKGRGLRLKFKWKAPDETDYEVAALHFGYEIENAALQPFHFVPASSVRGALRSWTINHLVHPNFRKDMTPPEHEDDPEEKKQKAYLRKIKAALSDPRSGYRLVTSLFGLAFETREVAKDLAHAGRLRIETEKFAHAHAKPIAINGILADGEVGPHNANRQMTVRNPLDRMTHASKEGGLHHFLEFCAGENFTAQLSILNPQSSDIGLISLWVREINDGMLRIGALSNLGRGRVAVTDQSYGLWQRPGAPKLNGFEHFVTAKNNSDDVLAGLWQNYKLPVAALSKFEAYLQEHV